MDELWYFDMNDLVEYIDIVTGEQSQEATQEDIDQLLM